MSFWLNARTLYKKLFKYAYVGGVCRYIHFKRALSQITISENAFILDAGCGNGEVAYALARRFPRATIHACDKNESYFWNRLILPNLSYEILDLSTSNFESQRFDLIYSIDVLEHIKDNRNVLKSLAQALRPCGTIIVLMPALNDNKRIFGRRFYKQFNAWAAKEHIGERYTLYELTQILEELGLRICYSRHTFGFFGQLAADIEALLRTLFGPLAKALIPLLLLLCIADAITKNQDGNGMCVVARKVLRSRDGQ
ncbi:MAG TPA: class I SAM-dependent methyltransferase [Nitrososphaera sp.]|nr:class I SAM-dependent methyltransferase [Nitrososphaera sp.]